jgi:magnesium transporter
MFSKRRSPPGSSPATLVPHAADGIPQPPAVRVMRYDKDRLEETQHATIADLEQAFEPGKVTWINIDGLGDIEALQHLADRLDLHPLTIEDVLNTGQRPKIEQTPGHIFLCLQAVHHDHECMIRGEQLSLFLGRGFVISVQEEADYDVFEPVCARLRSGRGQIRKSGADYLAYALLDSVIDHYYPVLEAIGTKVEDLEDALLEKPSRDTVLMLHGQRRHLTQMRRFVWPLRDVVNSLLHDSTGLVGTHAKVFLRDCYDHTVQLMDLVESNREVTAALMELYHSSVGLRTNEIMRVLTVITSIFIPLTFIVGVYGMNFSPISSAGEKLPLNMPELYHPYGYIGLMALMGIIALIQLALFRKMKWL